MDFLRTLIEVNFQIILFVYGLVFFVLGLSIALQSRRYSRLDLARSLTWLAAFGFMHSLQEWGDLFIPLQRAYLSEAAIQILWAVQLVLLAGSFACLFEFGVALLQPTGRARWWHAVSAAVFIVWAVVSFGFVLPAAPNALTWHRISNALARYFIAFPGGLLAAYGLRQQAQQRIAPLNVPHIYNTFRWAGWLLALYAVFGGLIPPAVPFFPGNWLNRDTFQATVGVPPLVVRSLIGLTLALVIIRALEIFEVETERLIETMEQQQILAAERLRLGRELHDGAIQMVYTAGLLVESARNLAPPATPLAGRLEKAVAALNDAIRDLRRNLDQLQTTPPAESLVSVLRHLSEDPRFQSLVNISLQVDLAETETLSPTRTDHLRAIATEALSNIVRHAQASHVRLSGQHRNGHFCLCIQDDGVGLPQEARDGYGLRNMRDRAKLLNGVLEVLPARPKGTLIQLTIPWKDER